ncbi:MAG: aminoglycoside phosphotransferase family protein [Caldilineaceae bacterium]
MSEPTSQPIARIYSHRLGALSPHQFQAALTRFGLGTFVDATPVTQGLFGQNVFIRSSQGEFVLRGAPHYPWQFPKERFGATLLHQRTAAPVAYPYLLDPTPYIFGWPYLLMPRLSGTSPADPNLTDTEQLAIAQALGQNLVHLQQLTWPVAGTYDLISDRIQPFEQGFAQWIVADIRGWLAAARANGPATTTADSLWIEQMIDKAHTALAYAFQPCFVMNDYNLGNLLVKRFHDAWRVSGLFDLMEYYFGNGEADLVRLIAVYLEERKPHGVRFAQAFARAYLAQKPAQAGFAERYALFMLRDRLIVWEYGTRPGNNWFAQGQSFRDYAEPLTESWRLVVPDSAA